MANNFNITISAIDKTTATVRKIMNVGRAAAPPAGMSASKIVF